MKFKKNEKIHVPCIYNCGYPQVLYLIFDTGAVSTTVDYSVLKRLAINPTGRARTFRTANNTEVLLDELKVSQFTVGNIDIGCCCVWAGHSIENLLGMDILSKLSWDYSHETQCLSIHKPTTAACESTASAYVRKFCSDRNISFDTLIATFPDNWENLGIEELANLTLFAYNNVLQRS